jgi:hypothetical protein
MALYVDPHPPVLPMYQGAAESGEGMRLHETAAGPVPGDTEIVSSRISFEFGNLVPRKR